MRTRLSTLAALLNGARLVGEGDPEVRRVVYDSRRVAPGDLFAALPGQKTDGARFVPDALARGAVALLLEEGPSADTVLAALPAPALVVPSAREALAWIAAALYDNPSRDFTLVGVTGTNGKTTTTLLVEAIFRTTGHLTGVIGTLGVRIGRRQLPGERTTPEAPDLQALFAAMRDAGVTAVSMEVSSHALAQHRTLGTEFDVAVFTNLTQDHLDYHGSMEAYYDAKARLFRDYPAYTRKPFIAVLNADDPAGQRLAGETRGAVVTYGVESDRVDVRATDISATPNGVTFDLHLAGEGARRIELPLGGHFNVRNALAASAVGWALGVPAEAISEALWTAPPVPGRFEAVQEGQEFSVIVDYAHTPDGLLNLLRAARQLSPARLLLVFGCGGDRDRAKRPQMGALAAEYADIAFVTSDNPRSEEPEAILREIVAGMREKRVRAEVRVDPDRREAIFAAIREARAGDLVLIAGKGHETYQIFADRTIPFDDREVAREALCARAERPKGARQP